MSQSLLDNDVKSFIGDLGARAGHAAWQSAAASIAVIEGSSGFGVQSVLTVSGIERVWAVFGIAALSAVLSAVKTATVTFIKTPQGKADLKEIEGAAEIRAKELLPKFAGGGSNVAPATAPVTTSAPVTTPDQPAITPTTGD